MGRFGLKEILVHSLSVVFGSMSWRLLYSKEENATRDYSALTSAILKDKTQQFTAHVSIELVDDFGQKICINTNSLHGCMLEDLDKTKLGNVEFALHGARANADAQKRAESDPALRAARNPSHMPLISPMGNGPLS